VHRSHEGVIAADLVYQIAFEPDVR
jgi:hypothetical protein